MICKIIKLKFNVYSIFGTAKLEKLITKNEYDKWISGFKYEGRQQKNFKIKCVNEKCHFHNELPIQVVDEMLYDKPPTLLFGTVDKFAMLAWREKGNRFFNSLETDKLPPDLIIQDELHLLTGPLGSITGIFESVIEMLCTNNGRKPKIISSTATTRNTDEQIKALYGNDKTVNVFPPSGLSYKDSFFAKVSKQKVREDILVLFQLASLQSIHNYKLQQIYLWLD